jgi:hypothetical protein
MARRGGGDALVVGAAAVAGFRMLRKDFSARTVALFASMALRRGMRSGSRGWLYAAAAATALKMLTSVLGRKEDVLSIRLRPGESFEIREIPRAK